MDRVEQYRRYRDAGQELNSRIIDTCLSDAAVTATADLLGFTSEDEEEDVMVFDGEEDMDVLYDLALHDYEEDGTTAVERAWEREIWASDVERTVLDAYRRASTSLFRVTDVEPSRATLVLADLLGEEEGIELVDVGFSGTAEPGVLLFTRRVPFDTFSTTSGAALPFPGGVADQLVSVYEEVQERVRGRPEAVTRFAAFYRFHQQSGVEVRYA